MELETLISCPLCGAPKPLRIDVEHNISKCGSCGFIFDNPRPTQMEITGYYSRKGKYKNWLQDEQLRESLWRRRLRKMLKHNVSGVLLDVGAGIGQFLKIAKSKFNEVYGTEVSQEAIKIAKEKFGIVLLSGVLEEIDFNKQKFDVITLFHVLEHVPNPKDTVQTCNSVLKPGGLLFVAVPNDLESLKVRVKLFIRKLGLQYCKEKGVFLLPKISLDGSIDELHLSHFTAGSLRYLFEHTGFKVAEVSLDPYFVASGRKLFMKNLYYFVLGLFQTVFKVNLYDTIWIVGRKI